jgi:uncharacterized protein
MPYPNEHAARLHDPAKYDHFRRENDKLGSGIDVIWGITKDDKTEMQAIRFNADKFTVDEAHKWLAAHDIKPILFEPAAPAKNLSRNFNALSKFNFEIKTVDSEKYEVEGFASVYGNVDLGGDIVEPGAFKRTLDHKATVPLLWNHDPGQVIGTAELSDSPSGLKVKGFLNKSVMKANEIYALLKQKAIEGFSIGYDTVKQDWDNGNRLLKEVALWEVSIVTFPMNELATVTAVKSAKSFNALMAQVVSAAQTMKEKDFDIETVGCAKTALETLLASTKPAGDSGKAHSPATQTEAELAEQRDLADIEKTLKELQTSLIVKE